MLEQSRNNDSRFDKLQGFLLGWDVLEMMAGDFEIVHSLKGVSVGSHSWIACRRRAQRPSVLCHGLLNGVIKWVKTREDIALIQETGPGM
jgi:hypothetical protein